MNQPVRHTKGVVLLELVRALKKWRRNQPEDAFDSLPPEDRELLEGALIIPLTWYPYDQLIRLLSFAFENMLGQSTSAFRTFCSAGTNGAYSGPHRRLICLNDPPGTVRNMPLLWRACHDFGDAHTSLDGNRAEVMLRNLGPLTSLEPDINAGWISGILERAGANHVQAEVISSDETVGDITLVFTWRANPAAPRSS